MDLSLPGTRAKKDRLDELTRTWMKGPAVPFKPNMLPTRADVKMHHNFICRTGDVPYNAKTYDAMSLR